MVFYRERAAGFCSDTGYQDGSLLQRTAQHVRTGPKDHTGLSVNDRKSLIARLDRVRVISHNLGHGVGDDIDSLLAIYVRR